MDWEKAQAYLKELTKQYTSLLNNPGCNPYFALGVLAAYKMRLEEGERTRALYDAIMDME